MKYETSIHYYRAQSLGAVAHALGWVGLGLAAVAVCALVLGSFMGACVAGAAFWAVAVARDIYETRSEHELVLMRAECAEQRRSS